ncbi:MAG: transcription antitermination factor NusB [Tissierellia bacterium]|nr:transcription antitermination factor NusB [Tissierellia bacterium]
MTRRATRRRLMQWIYSCEIQNNLDEVFSAYAFETIKEERELHYAHDLLEKLSENLELVDGLLDELSLHWPVARMNKVDLALLRLATVEILYLEDIPHEVSINEAMELSKTYSSPDSYSFINGILGSVVSHGKA